MHLEARLGAQAGQAQVIIEMGSARLTNVGESWRNHDYYFSEAAVGGGVGSFAREKEETDEEDVYCL